MPVGAFLDSLPSFLFIAAHFMFLVVGAWLVKKTMEDQSHYAPALGLYVVSQIGFLGFFGGLLTLKMSVLLEQTLIFVAILWIATQRHESRSTGGLCTTTPTCTKSGWPAQKV